ncbi:MAG: hypothetical protein R3190_17305 [Thermoanaerobaculia bacterium]|nr:hypothetical protein [Thermoanaerobaculia bacterium]
MKSLFSAFALLVLLAWTPIAARAQTGACAAYEEGGGTGAACADDVAQADCEALGELPGVATSFLEGETCAFQDNPWDGACASPSEAPFPCVLIDNGDAAESSQEICEDPDDGLGGTWLGAGSTCEGVPTLPLPALALLAAALLGCGLVLVRSTVSGPRLRSI